MSSPSDSLPPSDSVNPLADPASDPVAAWVQPPVPTPTWRALLVEDSRTLRRLMGECLTAHGASVTTAANGQEGLELAQRCAGGPEAFDLILMDVVMPILDGCEATYRLRREGYQGKIVILTAADQQKYDLARSLVAGADDFLPKPFTPEQLTRVLREHCPKVAA